MIDGYVIVVLLSGILGMYARYNFMKSFIENKLENGKFVFMVLALFYLVSNSVYFIYDIPIFNLLVQISFLTVLGVVMGIGLKKSLLATLIIIVILIVIESVVAFLTGYVGGSAFQKAEYQSIFGVIVVDVITLLASSSLEKYKNIKKRIEIPMDYWISIFIFPAISLVLLTVIFRFSQESKGIIITASITILMMNLIIFLLFDRLLWHYGRKLDEIAIRYMNTSYKRQLEMMRTSNSFMKSFQHDITKHIVAIGTLIKEKKYDELEEYVAETRKNVKNNRLISNTGNIIVDSIINYEVNHIDIGTLDILFDAKNIPLKLDIKDYDLTVVLSNSVSNALNAARKVDSGNIEIQLNYKKGVFFIQIENDFDGNVIMDK
ncbi:MAG: GHKL domain-containing protein [Clostridiales bacterium]|nr:GHKL domain-containing protein [Clostridiales bacterium]